MKLEYINIQEIFTKEFRAVLSLYQHKISDYLGNTISIQDASAIEEKGETQILWEKAPFLTINAQASEVEEIKDLIQDAIASHMDSRHLFARLEQTKILEHDILEVLCSYATDKDLKSSIKHFLTLLSTHLYLNEMSFFLFDKNQDRKSTRLNSSHSDRSRMPSSA